MDVLFQLTLWTSVIMINVRGNVLEHTWHTHCSAHSRPICLTRNRECRPRKVRAWSSKMKGSQSLGGWWYPWRWTCQDKLIPGDTPPGMWRTSGRPYLKTRQTHLGQRAPGHKGKASVNFTHFPFFPSVSITTTLTKLLWYCLALQWRP